MKRFTTTEMPAQGLAKYLTLRLGDGHYGLPILGVREIIGMTEVTRVPHAPMEMMGVINLRGRVIPVMDLRAHLGLDSAVLSPQTVIIVVQREGREQSHDVGLVVDEVMEVIELGDADIEARGSSPTQSLGDASVSGIGKVREGIVFLLDSEAIASRSIPGMEF